jgi:cell division protein FtsI (penicillin-binding protein 3)
MAGKRDSIVLRFGIVYFGIVLLFVAVLGRIIYLQTAEKDEWLAVAAKSKKTDILVKPNRGNIFACDGRLMASTIPTYYIYMDTRVPALRDDEGQLFKDKVDSLAVSLAGYFRDRTANDYKIMLKRAYRERKGELQLYPKRITYAQLKAVKKMPLFILGRNKSGLITKEMLRREKPFGSLASRTIGDIYAEDSKGGKNGLELYFNKELIGTPGVSIRQKVANRLEETVQVEPINGLDILTTIDLDMQDIAEKALVDSMRSFNASTGYALVMEVKTGEMKAIVNMYQNPDGTFSENKNGAVSDQVEPGSTFKTFSLIALLDEDKAKITDVMHTGNGVHDFAGRNMNDHNAKKGGFGSITLAEAMHGSSNVAISMAVVKAWGSNPSGYVEKLYEMGMNEKFDLEIPGNSGPKIRHPKDKARYWSATTLPWMSIGYESQIPPIYTLAYYNAIANKGKLIRPFFVKAIMRNGLKIKEFSTETIREQICRPSTLQIVHETLIGVLEAPKGTAQNVRSKYVRIAGKTGTAQISKGAAGYKAGGTSHQVSFCGYFPADDPQYTCIVVIREPKNGYPSGGKMAGSVFKSIAEEIIALKSNLKPEHLAQDTTVVYPFFPQTMNGYSKALGSVMSNLNLNFNGRNANWVKTTTNETAMEADKLAVYKNRVPDLKGMGAKDAMYLLGQLGLRVQVKGRGRVTAQDISAGSSVKKGQMIRIQLN